MHVHHLASSQSFSSDVLVVPAPGFLAILTSKGLEFEAGPSQDGSAIGAALRKHAIAIHSIGDNADQNGRAFRFEVSFQARFREAANREHS